MVVSSLIKWHSTIYPQIGEAAAETLLLTKLWAGCEAIIKW
jgi:hypothetical protein